MSRPALRLLVCVAAALAALRLVPPVAYAVLPPVVVAGELSPIVALLALVLAVVALRGRARRPVLAVVALATAAVASVPWFEGRTAARAGVAAVDALRIPQPAKNAFAANALAAAAVHRASDDGGRAVPYAAEDGTRLSARLFRSAAGGLRPTLVVFYSGAWRTGDAEQFAARNARLARDGYTVIALDYRHAPAHRYPAQLDDARLGLQLVRDSAAAWGVDAARIVLWGRSSGAHLAMLTAWTDSTRGAPPVRGVISYYGPVDLPEGYAHPPHPDPIGARAVLADLLGGTPTTVPAAYRDASPLIHVRTGLPPTLLVYGGHDHVVEARFGREVDRALVTAGDPVAYVELPWAEHGFDAVPGGVGDRVAGTITARFLARVTAP